MRRGSHKKREHLAESRSRDTSSRSLRYSNLGKYVLMARATRVHRTSGTPFFRFGLLGVYLTRTRETLQGLYGDRDNLYFALYLPLDCYQIVLQAPEVSRTLRKIRHARYRCKGDLERKKPDIIIFALSERSSLSNSLSVLLI